MNADSNKPFAYNPSKDTLKVGNIITSANITAAKFIKPNGTSSQFLKADGSVDSNTYVTTSRLNGYAKLSDVPQIFWAVYQTTTGGGASTTKLSGNHNFITNTTYGGSNYTNMIVVDIPTGAIRDSVMITV